MGGHKKYGLESVKLRPAQRNRIQIKSTSQSGEWYRVVDRKTGQVTYLRKSEKGNGTGK